jgi:hypothetical protein
MNEYNLTFVQEEERGTRKPSHQRTRTETHTQPLLLGVCLFVGPKLEPKQLLDLLDQTLSKTGEDPNCNPAQPQ